MQRLLFIEDDHHIRAALKLALEDEGYEIIEASDGLKGLAAFESNTVDLVLLDLRLPDLSGFEVCRMLRAKSLVPIIIVTAQTDTHDLVAGLEAGADDYVTKPVVAKELAARIRAALRRTTLFSTTNSTNDRFIVGDIEFRPHQGIVLKNDIELPLTKTEYRLLQVFLRIKITFCPVINYLKWFGAMSISVIAGWWTLTFVDCVSRSKTRPTIQKSSSRCAERVTDC